MITIIIINDSNNRPGQHQVKICHQRSASVKTCYWKTRHWILLQCVVHSDIGLLCKCWRGVTLCYIMAVLTLHLIVLLYYKTALNVLCGSLRGLSLIAARQRVSWVFITTADMAPRAETITLWILCVKLQGKDESAEARFYFKISSWWLWEPGKEPCTANEKFQKRESVVYIISFKENMSSRAEERVTGATLVCRCSHQIHLCAGLLSESWGMVLKIFVALYEKHKVYILYENVLKMLLDLIGNDEQRIIIHSLFTREETGWINSGVSFTQIS